MHVTTDTTLTLLAARLTPCIFQYLSIWKPLFYHYANNLIIHIEYPSQNLLAWNNKKLEYYTVTFLALRECQVLILTCLFLCTSVQKLPKPPPTSCWGSLLFNSILILAPRVFLMRAKFRLNKFRVSLPL